MNAIPKSNFYYSSDSKTDMSTKNVVYNPFLDYYITCCMIKHTERMHRNEYMYSQRLLRILNYVFKHCHVKIPANEVYIHMTSDIGLAVKS